jgi:hypothetical protein
MGQMPAPAQSVQSVGAMRLSARGRRAFPRRSAIAVAAFCTSFAASSPALADTPKDADRPHNTTWFPLESDAPSDFGFFRVEALAMRFTVPQLGVGSDDTPRRLVGIATPSNATMLYGGRLSLDLRWGAAFVQGFEMTYMQTAQGQSDWERANGAPVLVDRDVLHKFDFGLTGGGFQAISPNTRFKASFKADWGMSVMWSSVALHDASGTASSGTVGDTHLYARAEIAVCQRANAALYDWGRTWACVTVAPNIYEEGWFNGVAVGLRTDF